MTLSLKIENIKSDQFYMWTKGQTGKFSEFLKLSEVDCKCLNAECRYTWVYGATLILFHLTRSHFGVPLTITSAFRCLFHNHSKEVKGARGSLHTIGKALDIRRPLHIPWPEFIEGLEQVGWSRIKVYDDPALNFAHCEAH